MRDRPVGRAYEPLNSLADLHLSEETLDSVLVHIGHLGVEALRGWDAAAASLVLGQKTATFGATDERVSVEEVVKWAQQV